ncbi:MAG TPA: inosine/xanthosine triphosphatase [Candidatus Nanoarchaeia archaeon]|nr:inosine/xanthosine triphosphatase [Candidatus Nanoarchaeia archaeon]
MKITIGSTNDVKVEAVREVIHDYDILSNAEVNGIDVNSEVSEQPKSLNETIHGAMNRAKNAFRDCNYSFGIESGLMQVPNTKTGYMDVCACVIYDGKDYHIGLSSAFEYPHEIARLVFKDGLGISQAAYRTGLTKNPKVGSAEGVIGILTRGRLPRKEYTKQAIVMALIHLENSKLY